MSIDWKVIRARFRGKRATMVLLLVIAFVILDVSAGLYISNCTSAELPNSEFDLEGGVTDVEPTSAGPVYVLSGDTVIRASPQGLTYLWSDVDSIAVGHDTMDIAYVRDGALNMYISDSQESLTVPFDGYALSIGERWKSDGTKSAYAICVAPSPGNDTVIGFDIATGNVSWSVGIGANITSYDANDGSRYFVIADDTGNVTVLSMTGEVKRVYGLGPVDEVTMAIAGTRFAAIAGNTVSICFEGEVVTVEMSEDVTSAQFKAYDHTVFVRSNDTIYAIDGSSYEEVLTMDGIVGYCVPSVSDRLYVSLDSMVTGYRFPREVAAWESAVDVGLKWMSTDPSGSMVVGVSESSATFISDESPLGNSELWLVLGSCLIAEIVITIVLLMYDRVRYIRRETLYVVPIGIALSASVAYLFPSGEAVVWFGSMTSYLLIATALASVSVIVAWWSESGFGSFMFGFMASVLAAIPVSMAAAFVLSATGYTFSVDSYMLTSLLKSLTTAGWMGAIGGAYAVIVQSILEW